jgi:hypothetical protein
MPAMPDPTTTTSQVVSPSSAPAAGMTSTSIQSDLLGIVCSQKNENTEWLPRFLRKPLTVRVHAPGTG